MYATVYYKVLVLYLSTNLYKVACQKTVIRMVISVKTLKLTKY